MDRVIGRSLSPWGIPWVREESAERLEWRKGVWNASMNGLLALADRRNGALLEEESLAREFEALLDEACAVASAEGYDLTAEDREMIWSGVRGSRTNWNSMHGDLRAGRPTELP